MFDLQSEASEMRRGEARLPELCKERGDMWRIQEGVPVARVWQLRGQGEYRATEAGYVLSTIDAVLQC